MAAVVAVTDILLDVEKNSGPVWYPISYFTDNDEDPAGGGLVLTITTPSPVGCTAVLDATGENIVVTPNYNYTGLLSFYYRITDIDTDFDEVIVTGNVLVAEYQPNVILSNEENTEWLSKDNHKIILIDVVYHDGISEKVKYFSSYPYLMDFNEVDYVNIIGESVGNIGYDDVISRTPILSSQIDSSTNVGLVELLNVNGEFDELLNYAWEGHPIGIYIGEPSWARGRFIQIFEGVVNEFTSPNSHSLAITIIDKAEILNVSVQDKFINTDDDYLLTLYDSSPTQPAFPLLVESGRKIPEATEDTPVPICLGKCYNISPVLIDVNNQVYQIHDGTIEEVIEVRSNGVALSEGSGYVVNLAIGCIQILVYETDNPTITCDVAGQIPRSSLAQVPPGTGFYPYAVITHSVAYIIEWLLLEKTTVTIDDLCEDTFPKIGADGFDVICGIYIKEETTVADSTKLIMDSISGYLRFSRPPSIVQLLRIIDPVGEIASAELVQDNILERGVSLVGIEIPKKSINLGYQKNWTVQDTELAGVVTEQLLELYAKLSEEYLNYIVDTDVTNIDELYPLLIESDVIGTLIYDNVTPDFWAQTEANRRMGLRKVKRFIYRIQATATPFTISVGDIVYITHFRYGFENGKHALVISLEEDPLNKKVTLEVWL